MEKRPHTHSGGDVPEHMKSRGEPREGSRGPIPQEFELYAAGRGCSRRLYSKGETLSDVFCGCL